MALVPLLIAMVICLGISIYPRILINAHGYADHAAASLLFWSMSAGFIRGVGYIPRIKLFRYLGSSLACYLTLAAALYMLCRPVII